MYSVTTFPQPIYGRRVTVTPILQMQAWFLVNECMNEKTKS